MFYNKNCLDLRHYSSILSTINCRVRFEASFLQTSSSTNHLDATNMQRIHYITERKRLERCHESTPTTYSRLARARACLLKITKHQRKISAT